MHASVGARDGAVVGEKVGDIVGASVGWRVLKQVIVITTLAMALSSPPVRSQTLSIPKYKTEQLSLL